MIRCIAIDDEPKALDVLMRYCGRIETIQLLATFRQPLKTMDYITTEKPDLIFLDINMPDISGLQFPATLPEKPMIIFATAYSEFALESYSLNAVDYLLKPISFDRFLVAVNKAIALHALKQSPRGVPEFIRMKSGAQMHQVKTEEILFLEKNGNYLTVVTKTKRILLRENMTQVFDIIPRDVFIRVHKSYVIALKHISTVEVHQVTVGEHKIPLGASYRESLKRVMGIE